MLLLYFDLHHCKSTEVIKCPLKMYVRCSVLMFGNIEQRINICTHKYTYLHTYTRIGMHM